MRRLLFLCLGLVALLGACGPVYNTQYSLIPPTSVEGRNCVSQCQQNRSICRQTCSIGEQSCLNEARSRAYYEYQAYVDRQRAEKKPIKKNISDFERTYACGPSSCEQRCDADYRDCFGSVCGGRVIAQKVCTAFCDQPPPTTAPAAAITAPTLGAAPPAGISGPMSVPPAPVVQEDRTLCRRGMRVEVEWKGDWYPATVKGSLRNDGRCPVHYDDYGSENDEDVSLRRMRPR